MDDWQESLAGERWFYQAGVLQCQRVAIFHLGKLWLWRFGACHALLCPGELLLDKLTASTQFLASPPISLCLEILKGSSIDTMESPLSNE